MTPWVSRLLLTNVVVFLLTTSNPLLGRALGFAPAAVLHQPWLIYTVITYMFVHAGLWHIFFNMLGLFFFGPRLEMRLGGTGFLRLYFWSGFGGALLSVGQPNIMIIGASGAVFGVLLAYAMFWPTDQIYIWGVLPVQARWLVVFLTVMSLWQGLDGVQDNVAHFAHLGGFGAAFLYIKWRQRNSPAEKFKRQAYGMQPTPTPERPAMAEAWRNIKREGMHELNLEELDRILEKIASLGVEALTLDERAFLDRFSMSS